MADCSRSGRSGFVALQIEYCYREMSDCNERIREGPSGKFINVFRVLCSGYI